ncbi:MAG: chemotaxis response regulator protein-glutamate methylesterase [Pseudomonadota bacterium]
MTLPERDEHLGQTGETRVVVVDDSPSMRLLLEKIINAESDMRVVGSAPDPFAARELIKQLQPDVVTLDIEMPGMDGLDFLERLMRLNPLPVLMISSRTEEGSEYTLRALELGAMDVICKQNLGEQGGLSAMAREITAKVRLAGTSSGQFQRRAALQAVEAGSPAMSNAEFDKRKIIFVGASTGGTEAIKQFVEVLPVQCPPVLITQHMPEGFTARFAKRLDDCCAVRVKEAAHKELIQTGWVYIAPGHSHLTLHRRGDGRYETQLSDAPEVNRHRPSVDVLFHSAADEVGPDALAVLLTGMGKDGAVGLLRMHEQGALTLTQSAESCVVYGMPRAAVELGASVAVGTPRELAEKVLTAARLKS